MTAYTKEEQTASANRNKGHVSKLRTVTKHLKTTASKKSTEMNQHFCDPFFKEIQNKNVCYALHKARIYGRASIWKLLVSKC